MQACGGGGGQSISSTPSTPSTPPPAVANVAVTPNPATATVGATVQFAAAVTGSAVSDKTVAWKVSAPSNTANGPGSIDANGLYVTPYPAPATVTVTATSNQDKTVSGSVTVTLQQPASSSGPAITVDTTSHLHAINPFIYGMNAFAQATGVGKAAGMTVDRWGGDATSRYNYQLDVTSAASDWYFENAQSATGVQDTSAFNAQVASDISIGAKTIGTVPVLGWVAKDSTSCSFPTATYPNQAKVDPFSGRCGNGQRADLSNITGNDPTSTSTAINGATWASGWVTYLVSKFGTAASGGVAIYDLDNEPTWWDAVHRDVHPVAFTYDEVTNNGLAVAKAIKSADPTAEVSGPVIDYWWSYFYSKKDIESGWGSGPCFQPWQNPVDRKAHGGAPLIEYYLQQFAAAEQTGGTRLLDYLDLHTYFTPQFPLNSGNSVGFTTAGDTLQQQLRLDSTRVFWDPTYTDPDADDIIAGKHNQPFTQPNYITDANYTANCFVPAQAPQVIPMMKNWVARDYPGTKLAITEYNWGGQEHINGALAQADILGIFGREGLDIGTLWGTPDPIKQIPGLEAFKVFRNYDGNNSTFGDVAVTSISTNQSKLSAYAAFRSSDHALTLVILNKTYGDLSSTLSITGLPTTTTTAKSFLYSQANLNAIVPQSNLPVTPGLSTAPSTLTSTFPAQSITILVMQD